VTRLLWLTAAVTLLGAGCTHSTAARTPEQRAVTIETDACGYASRTDGSGVLVSDAKVVTAAHVVIGASAIRVVVDGEEVGATVVTLDTTTDLALLQLSGVSASAVELATLSSGDFVTAFGAKSGAVDATVTRRLRMTVDNVRRETRSERSGFELNMAISPGDSGAGVFDSRDSLVGIVFATPRGRANTTFAVDASEIEALLNAPTRQYRCDTAASLVVPATPDVYQGAPSQ